MPTHSVRARARACAHTHRYRLQMLQWCARGGFVVLHFLHSPFAAACPLSVPAPALASCKSAAASRRTKPGVKQSVIRYRVSTAKKSATTCRRRARVRCRAACAEDSTGTCPAQWRAGGHGVLAHTRCAAA